MPSIKKRIQLILDAEQLGPADMAKRTGMSRDRWANMLYKTTRVGDDHIDAIVKMWPQYAYWLITGGTLPQAGQISPELEKIRKDSERDGKAG